jgi:hypothetical protein
VSSEFTSHRRNVRQFNNLRGAMCDWRFIQPGQDSLCHGLPAWIEHTVVCHIRNDLNLGVVCPRRSFNLTGSKHVISRSTQDK